MTSVFVPRVTGPLLSLLHFSTILLCTQATTAPPRLVPPPLVPVWTDGEVEALIRLRKTYNRNSVDWDSICAELHEECKVFKRTPVAAQIR